MIKPVARPQKNGLWRTRRGSDDYHRKALFAAKHIDRPFVRVMIGASMEAAAEKLMESLGMRSIVRARIEADDKVEAIN